MNRVERAIEAMIFSSRWLAAPFLFGLIIGLAALLYKFMFKLAEFVTHVSSIPSSGTIVSILGLVDLSLTANLVLIVICSSYENFVRRIAATAHPDIPDGLIGVGFDRLKQKLLGSIVAITAVHTLEWYLEVDIHGDAVSIALIVGGLVAFAVTMLLISIAERVSRGGADADH